MSQVRAIHQVVGKSSPGYSVSDYALALQGALRDWGYESLIYASEVDPTLRERVSPLRDFSPSRNRDELVLLHYVMATEVTDWMKGMQVPLILCYHNVTPSRFFTGLGGALARSSQRGQMELAQFREQTVLALADSEYNKQDLLAAGYPSVQVQPLLIPYALQEVKPDATVVALADGGPNLLFVGRLAPNKRCEDIIKVLHQYRQIEPDARLYLVGARRYTQRYVDWLRDFVGQLGLEESVIFTGHVSQEALAAYYQIADAFVMMSEHEGFGIPLVESMRFGVPIVAYASTAVPETLGGSGILIHQKRFSVIAELIHLLRTDSALRSRIIERQRARAQDFAPEVVLAQFRHHIDKAVNAL